MENVSMTSINENVMAYIVASINKATSIAVGVTHV